MSLAINTQAERTLINTGTGAYYPIIDANTGRAFGRQDYGSIVSPTTNFYTCSRFGTTNGSVLTSAAVTLVPIRLPVGLVVTKIGFVSATTAAA